MIVNVLRVIRIDITVMRQDWNTFFKKNKKNENSKIESMTAETFKIINRKVEN